MPETTYAEATNRVTITEDTFREMLDHLTTDDCVDALVDQAEDEACDDTVAVVPSSAVQDAAALFEFLYETSEEYYETEAEMRALATVFRAAVSESTRLNT